eukprot:6650448-Alexandrium_andersonii.AAC.1
MRLASASRQRTRAQLRRARARRCQDGSARAEQRGGGANIVATQGGALGLARGGPIPAGGAKG